MFRLQRVSGVWTFLLAILLSLAAGTIGFVVTTSLLVCMGLSITTLLVVVFIAQWS